MIVRKSTPSDAAGMARLLNAIIALGGTTAHEHPKTEAEVRTDYIDGPDVLTSVLAEEAGQIVGWQSVGMWQGDPHVGTFVAPGVQAKGIGQAMFAATCAGLRSLGVAHVIAHIRADNVPGLAYYARIGFCDIGAEPDFALTDGRVVGRIHRRFDL